MHEEVRLLFLCAWHNIICHAFPNPIPPGPRAQCAKNNPKGWFHLQNALKRALQYSLDYICFMYIYRQLSLKQIKLHRVPSPSSRESKTSNSITKHVVTLAHSIFLILYPKTLEPYKRTCLCHASSMYIK